MIMIDMIILLTKIIIINIGIQQCYNLNIFVVNIYSEETGNIIVALVFVIIDYLVYN
jgi:hypothetical protein